MKKLKFLFALFMIAIMSAVVSHFLEPVIVEAQQRILNNPIIRGRISIVSIGHSWDGNLISDADGTDNLGATGTRWLTGYFNAVFGDKGADIASAAALALGTDGSWFDVTGTTSITSISAKDPGFILVLKFDGILTVTDDNSALELAGNFVTTAKDMMMLISEGSGSWRELSRTIL